jgi:hypothetical protein
VANRFRRFAVTVRADRSTDLRGAGGFALTEPGNGPDAGWLRTKAIRAGDHWVLSGEKLAAVSAGPPPVRGHSREVAG